MDATLNDEESLLAETAGRVAAGLSGDAADVDADRAWRALDESGFVAMRADSGPGGASVVDAVLCAEAFGRAASAIPLVGPLLAVELLRVARTGGEEDGRSAAGGGRATIALDGTLGEVAGATPGAAGAFEAADPAMAFDALGASVAVGLDGGRPVAVDVGPPVAGSADLSRVVAGLTGEPRPLAGDVDAVRLERWRSFGLVLVSADMVGTMAGALAMAVGYASQRRQFGRPIGSFQAVQHLCAEQHVSVEAARSITYYAAWAVDHPEEAAGAEIARVAKAYVGRVARQVGEAVVQVHGGIGHTWECDAHRYLRRLLVDRAVLGDEHRQEGELAASIVGGDSPGGGGQPR
jgi:alkylation response protein AidB-like acyl-CoA dehydrogenase